MTAMGTDYRHIETIQGWQVKTDNDKPNLVVFDFRTHTSRAGFSFSVEMKGNDTDNLLTGVEHITNFDPDYEAYL